MIRASILDRLFLPERHRRQAATIQSGGGFKVPLLQERHVESEEGPFLVSNMRRQFIQGRRSSEGNIRFAFSDCSVEEEDGLLAQFLMTLWQVSVENGWGNRCNTLAEAQPLMAQQGTDPRSLLVPYTLLAEAVGASLSLEEAKQLMATQGHIVEVYGVRVLFWESLPENAALLVGPPAMAGVYTRVDRFLAILATRVDRAFVLVRQEVERAVA